MLLARLKRFLIQPAILSSTIVTAVLLGAQQAGLLQPIELKAFDQLMQRRSQVGPDSRLLIVAVTEKDLQTWNWPLPSRVLDNVLGKLSRYQPRVIGLDIFRDLPVEPGHAQLLQRLQQDDRIVPICKHGDGANPETPPPAGVTIDRVGFSDLVEDTDGIIRRSLLAGNSPSPNSVCATNASFGLQLAIGYLTDVQPYFTPAGDLQLGKALVKRLQPRFGAYQQDTSGFQILLNYRAPTTVAQQVTLSDVLSDRVNPNWVKDRVVLIGSTAPSLRDFVNTPYSTGKRDNSGKIPGIVLHAHAVSQLVGAALGERTLFWTLPEWGEVLWAWGWALLGGAVAWRIQHPLRLTIVGIVALGALLGATMLVFTQAGWLPIAPAALGLLLSGGGVVLQTAYQTKQQRDRVLLRVQDQEQTISLLQALLRDSEDDDKTTMIPIEDQPRHASLLDQRYQIKAMLGSGGFGCTYLAEDTQRPGNPECVVKQLQPARQDERFLQVARRLFRTEGEILERLGQHDQIPQLLAFFEQNQQFYLVQEYVAGRSLHDELPPGDRQSDEFVVALLKDVLHVLSFIHSHRVIHRDIKPSNLIRRSRDGRLVLIDFGAVKQIQPLQNEETVAIGTAGYAPPEQLNGHPRLNSDLYALGMVGIQALTGKQPRDLQRDPDTGELLWRSRATSQTELGSVLDRLVAYDFIQRYQSASEVLQHL